jgi:hypothetical protein
MLSVICGFFIGVTIGLLLLHLFILPIVKVIDRKVTKN